MTSLCLIRQAVRNDIPALCWMLDQLRQETVWRSIPVESDYTYAAEQFEWMLLDPDHFIAVAELDGEQVGMVGGMIRRYPFLCTVPYVNEWALWVAPAHRRHGVGSVLWRRMVEWGKQKGALGAMYGRPKAVSHVGSNVVIEEMVWHYWGTP